MLKLPKDMRGLILGILIIFLAGFATTLAIEDCVKLMKDRLDAFTCNIPKIDSQNNYVKDRTGAFVLRSVGLQDFIRAIKPIAETSKPYTSATLETAADDLVKAVSDIGKFIYSSDFSVGGFESKLSDIDTKVAKLAGVLDLEIRTNPNGNGVSWGMVKAALQDEVAALGVFKGCLTSFKMIKEEGLACEKKNKDESANNLMAAQTQVKMRLATLKNRKSTCLEECAMKLEMKNPDKYKK